MSLVNDEKHVVSIAFFYFDLSTKCLGHPRMTIFVIGCERLHFKISFEMVINHSLEQSKSKLHTFSLIDKVP